ncbi:MAG: C39 family peptidase [Anaerolineaceae bacterium]|nr:C39 family peptidase [Anaerolineaceae bacterium]
MATLIILALMAYQLPAVNERFSWRVENLRYQLIGMLRPPSQAVFVPQQSVNSIVEATLRAYTPSAAPVSSATPTAPAATPNGPSETPSATATPTLTPTAIPARVELKGILHEYQKWNNCGPSTLSMNLSFWKWKGTQLTIAGEVKPNPRDKNVMPYELMDYVLQNTQMRAIVRPDGTVAMLKQLVAAGFPVMVEKGLEISGEGWMGHYAVINGYEDGKARFLTQDSYSQPDGAIYLAAPYSVFADNWRAFNYIYLVVYPPEREAEVQAILGVDWDEAASYRNAAQRASDEVAKLSGRDQFFAWYNRGTSLAGLSDYLGAAAAYDEAFKIYATIPEKKMPRRMVWYQTGPYFAYFYTGRYQDVINLATVTLQWATEPAIEESWIWRARARGALGDVSGAADDARQALKWHPGFGPAIEELAQLGQNP